MTERLASGGKTILTNIWNSVNYAISLEGLEYGLAKLGLDILATQVEDRLVAPAAASFLGRSITGLGVAVVNNAMTKGLLEAFPHARTSA